MKIVYLSTNITGSGGVARVTSQKTNYFIEKWGYEVFIISTNDQSSEPFYPFNSKVKFYLLPDKMKSVFSVFKLYRQINKCIKTIAPDLVLVNDNGIKSYFAPFLIQRKTPVLLEVHGAVKFSFQTTHTRLQSMFISKGIDFSASRFDRMILLNQESKSEWNTLKLTVIPNYIEVNPLDRATAVEKRIVALGRICKQKGYDRMLTIWGRIVKKHPDWSLHIYGKVEDEVLYANLLSRSIPGVCFHGETSEVSSKLKSADFFIHTAYFEGMPMVLLEAMAEGVTGVVFDAPFGINEIVKEGLNGFVIKDNDQSAFERQVNYLIENQDQRMILESNTKKSVERFSEEKVMLLWQQLLLQYRKKQEK